MKTTEEIMDEERRGPVQDCPSHCSTWTKRPHKVDCLHFRGEIKQRDLKLADVVELGGVNGYGTATIERIADGMVHLFRPYTMTADFSCSGGVICYIGVEHFSVFQDSDRTFKLVGRKELK